MGNGTQPDLTGPVANRIQDEWRKVYCSLHFSGVLILGSIAAACVGWWFLSSRFGLVQIRAAAGVKYEFHSNAGRATLVRIHHWPWEQDPLWLRVSLDETGGPHSSKWVGLVPKSSWHWMGFEFSAGRYIPPLIDISAHPIEIPLPPGSPRETQYQFVSVPWWFLTILSAIATGVAFRTAPSLRVILHRA